MWTFRNKWTVCVAIAAGSALVLVLAFSEVSRRNAPMNYILLGMYTIFMSFLLGAFSSIFGTEVQSDHQN